MRRIAVGLVAAGVLASTATASAIDFEALPYYTFDRMQISTNGSWSGATPVDVSPFELSATSDRAFAGLSRRFVWGSRCGRAPERRSFSTKVIAPGVPSVGTFSLFYGPGRDRPFETASMTVNGVEVVRLPRTAGKGLQVSPYRTGTLSESARRAFRYGSNTIVITATKARLKKGQACNSRRVPRHVAVFGELSLRFASDLKVSSPVVPVEVIRHVRNEEVVGITGTVTTANVGDSSAVSGDLRASMSGDGISVIDGNVAAPGPPFHDCAIASSTMTCQYTDFPPHMASAFTIRAAMRVNTGYFKNGAGRASLLISLAARSGYSTVNDADNEQRKVLVLCTDGATDPACA